jgi:alkylation response protein AidB-like acyl-CoA dehydrogenase
VHEGDHWQLHGEKWFCSNADAEVVMLLARPEIPVRTRGVGTFLMPRRLPDGSQNHYRIVRLKDKLGTARWPQARSSWKARLPTRSSSTADLCR